jgi:hypothetical protein
VPSSLIVCPIGIPHASMVQIVVGVVVMTRIFLLLFLWFGCCGCTTVVLFSLVRPAL